MAIGSNYFSHDYGARNDRKMVRLRMKYQMKGVGIFWSLLEMIYEEGGQLLLSDIDIISNELKEKSAIVEDVIRGFDLFEDDGKYFWSISAKRRIDKRFEKTKKAQESAEKRWEKSERNANAMRTHSDGNAIKESKVKESKVKESKRKEESGADAPTPEQILEIRKKAFYATLVPFLNQYGKETLRDFYEYWTEPNKSKSLFKQEMQKTWDLSMRLKNWVKRDTSFVKQNPVISIDPLSSRLAKDEKIRKEVYGD